MVLAMPYAPAEIGATTKFRSITPSLISRAANARWMVNFLSDPILPRLIFGEEA
jgi:hypothetical protein